MDDSVVIRAEFPDVSDEPMQFVNAFAISGDGQTFFLIVGQASPPILQGTIEQQRQQAQEALKKTLKIRPVAKLVMTLDKLNDLIIALTSARDQMRSKQKGA
jgi:hypothetical protein